MTRPAGPACASDPQDQLVDILDQIVDAAIGDTDFLGQFAGFQAAETFCRNCPFRRLDQRFAQFCPSFQCFGHVSPVVNRNLEHRSNKS